MKPALPGSVNVPLLVSQTQKSLVDRPKLEEVSVFATCPIKRTVEVMRCSSIGRETATHAVVSFPNHVDGLEGHDLSPNVHAHRTAPGELCKARRSCARPRAACC